MPIVLANGKKAKLIEQERTYLNTLKLRLFVNNLTPAESNVLADFTPCTDSGYAEVTNVGFTTATLNGSNEGQVLAPAITWTFTLSGGSFTVYGYYMVDPSDTTLVYSERAASPFTVSAAGTTYTVIPKKVMTTLA